MGLMGIRAVRGGGWVLRSIIRFRKTVTESFSDGFHRTRKGTHACPERTKKPCGCPWGCPVRDMIVLGHVPPGLDGEDDIESDVKNVGGCCKLKTPGVQVGMFASAPRGERANSGREGGIVV